MGTPLRLVRYRSRFATWVIAAGLLAGACAQKRAAHNDASEPTGPAEQTTVEPNGTTVEAEVVDTAFKPATLKISVGTTVEWVQTGLAPHSVTAADGSFDSSPDCGSIRADECLGPEDRFTHVFDEPGTFIYYCRVHGLPDGTGMAARVVVEGQ